MPGTPHKQKAFQIDKRDNVATALAPLSPGEATLTGERLMPSIAVVEDIPAGHKVALRDIAPGEDIVKYGVVIGRAFQEIRSGGWVHLHCIRSVYDERSSHLDPVTGAPTDIRYE